MRDESWWDDEETEHVAALQRVLMPLREGPRPWGDVLAQARVGVVPRGRVARPWAIGGATAAVAAALVVGWLWGRVSAPVAEPSVVPIDPPPACELAVTEPLPAPAVVHLALPIPVDVTDVAVLVQNEKHHSDLVKLLQNLERNKTLKALVEIEPDEHGKVRRRGSAAKQQPNAARDEELPLTLTTGDIKRAIEPLRAEAKACGAEHGAAADTSVRVKLRIIGATGLVESAYPQSPHDTGSLGRCVADVLAKARFPRFQKPGLGLVYPIRM